MQNSSTTAIERWVTDYISREEPRSKSLIVTVFGDSIAPYTPGIWLGDLISLMSTLGVNERLVRTSAFRLIEEGWLQSDRRGRRSYYTLTSSGTQRFESAYQHIYQSYLDHWDGEWTLVVLQRSTEATLERSELRKELEWNGFSLVSNGVFMHPTAELSTASKIIKRNGYEELALIFRAKSIAQQDGLSNDDKIRSSWNLDDIRQRYSKFISDFQLLPELIEATSLTPQLAFQIQTLMIHSFRRANLHDPQLPLQLLPEDWPRHQSFALCKEVYNQTCELAHAFVGQIAQMNTSIEAGIKLNIPVIDRFKS